MCEQYLLTDLCQTGCTTPAKSRTGYNERAQSRCGDGLEALIPKYLSGRGLNCTGFFLALPSLNWTISMDNQLLGVDTKQLVMTYFAHSALVTAEGLVRRGQKGMPAGSKTCGRRFSVFVFEYPNILFPDGLVRMAQQCSVILCGQCVVTPVAVQRRHSWCQTGQMLV